MNRDPRVLLFVALACLALAGCSKAVKIDAAEYKHEATRQPATPVANSTVRVEPVTTTTTIVITLPERDSGPE